MSLFNLETIIRKRYEIIINYVHLKNKKMKVKKQTIVLDGKEFCDL